MISADVIDVYNIALEGNANLYEERFALLSIDEQERAARFKFDHHRIDWVNSRAALRGVLARHTHVAAKDVNFTIRPDGKPELRGLNEAAPGTPTASDWAEDTSPSIYFNLSHSGKRALIAVSHFCDLGCDIEHVKRIRDWPGVARRFFSTAEQNELATVEATDKNLAFHLCWTRKEAVIKTTGEGLHADLSSFDVSMTPGKQALVYADRGSDSSDLPWHLFHIDPGNNYVGAVAVRARSAPKLRLHTDWESMFNHNRHR